MMQSTDAKQNGFQPEQVHFIERTLFGRWEQVKLGNVASVSYGKARPNEDGIYPVIGSGGIYGYTSQPLVTYETLVIGRKGNAGSVYYSSGPCYPSDTTFYLSWKQEVCVPFIYFSLLYQGLAPDKSVIPSLQRGDIEGFSILLPSLPEQRAIVHVLQLVQNAIQARRQEITLERERKATLMQHLFTHGIGNEPTKQSEVGEIPESWQIHRLGDFLLIAQYGLSLAGNTSGTYPILRMNNLMDGTIYFGNLQYVHLDDELFKKFKLNRGDVLFNRTNSSDLVGKTALFNADKPAVFASYLIRLVTDKGHLRPAFLNAYFNWGATQQRLRALASRGVSQANISASKLQAFKIAVPSTEEQEKIVDVLNACDSKITALEQELSLYEELFQALLEELMTGRLSTAPLLDKEVYNERTVSGTETDDPLCHSNRMELPQA